MSTENKVLTAYEWWKETYPNEFGDNYLDCSLMQEYADYYYKEMINRDLSIIIENTVMKQALQKIANPIAYLQQEAEEQNGQLDGMRAIALANNANWLSSVAARALHEVSENEAQKKLLSDAEDKVWDDQREAMFNAWKEKEDKKEQLNLYDDKPGQ